MLLLLLLLSPPSSPTLTQPMRCGSMPPPLPPASHLPNAYTTARAMFGTFPNTRPDTVTPRPCVRPLSSRTPAAPRSGQLHMSAGSRSKKRNCHGYTNLEAEGADLPVRIFTTITNRVHLFNMPLVAVYPDPPVPLSRPGGVAIRGP